MSNLFETVKGIPEEGKRFLSTDGTIMRNAVYETAMKLISMICPHCGAQLSIDLDRRQAFCQYCGNTLLIDDENTVNIDAVTWMEQGSRRADG